MGCERCLSVCQAYISMLLYTHDAPIGIVKILPKILCARLTFQCFAQCCYTHALCHYATIFPKILSVCRAHISMLKRPHPLNAAMHTKCKIILPKIFPKVITKVIAQILPKVLSVSQVHISIASLNGCLCTQTVSARSHCQKYCQVMTKVITKMLSQVLISMAPLNGSMVVYAHKEGSSSYYSEVARLTLASGEAIEASKRNYHHTITLPLPHLLQGTAEIFPKILLEILHLVGPSGCSVTTVGLQRQHHRGCVQLS